jgi:hypothetical protein
MEEYIKADEPAIGKDAVEKRIGALRDLFAHHDDMTAEQLAEVMTASHFDAYFADAISRMFYDAYQYRGAQWRDYTYPDTTPDFRDVKRFRMSEPGTLRRRREMQAARQTYVSDSGVVYGVEAFAEAFAVSWQAIMNDDLGAIRQVPQAMFRAATRFEDVFVSDLYDNATTQAALVALGALFAGTGRLTEANLATAITAIRTRTDANGNKMEIRGIWLVTPPELEIQRAKVLESAQIAGSADNDKNVIPQFIRGVRTDPHIATSGADQPWYLVADPSEIPTIPVARLQGAPGPWVARKRPNLEMVSGAAPAAYLMGSFETGEIEYVVEDVIGGGDDATYVGVLDRLGIYYSSGTTP